MATQMPPVTFNRNKTPAPEEERRQRLANTWVGNHRYRSYDHMAIAHYANGEWQTVAVTLFSALTLHPGSKCF